MTPLHAIILILMSLVFLVWAFEMFRMLFRISRRADEKLNETGGGYFTWAGHSVSSYAEFFTSDKTRPHRRRLIALTILLFAVILAQVFFLHTPG